MKLVRAFGCTLALQLVIQAVSYQQSTDGPDLMSYTVLGFLQDVLELQHYDQLVFAHNRNASLGPAFVAQTQLKLMEPVDGLGFKNFRPAASVDYEEQFVRNVMTTFSMPVIIFNEFGVVQLRQHFSRALLLVVYLEESLVAQSALFKALIASLKHRTLANTLFLINNINTTASCDEVYLRQLFQFCWQSKMINVAALCADYKITKKFYSYTHFPTFSLEYKPITALQLHDAPVFLNRLSNLKGYKLPYIIGGADPRIIIYDYNGKRIVGGFVGHFLYSFSVKYNFKLYEPLPSSSITKFAPPHELFEAVRNNTAEISAGITFPDIPYEGFSYPYEQLNWCLWTPMEADTPNYDFFWIVFEGMAFALALGTVILISVVLSCALWQHGKKPDLIRFFIHDSCLRGVLGQSFRELTRAPFVIRFIYLQICVLGILLTTTYNAYFATYWTSAPKVPPFRNFDDILHSHKKIYVYAPEYMELIARAPDLRKYIPLFKVENDYHNYLATRDTFNTKYIYMIPTTKWLLYREQQKVFTTPIFRLRNDLCFYHNIPMCFPMPSESIFSEILQDMIFQTAQAGLTEFWMRNGFLELIRAGRLGFEDLSRRKEYSAMAVEDMMYVWMGYGIACAITFSVFLAEHCYFRRKSIMKFLLETRWHRFRNKKSF